MSATMQPKNGKSDVLIYFLASPKDEDVCEAIHRHLRPIIRTSEIPIRVLDDFDIPAGDDRDEHRRQLLEADIVLSLISADFIDDDDIYSRNQRVIERYNKGETLMVSILVRNCLWKASPLAQFPLLPKNLQPLNNKQFWNSEDDAVMAVVADLYDSINGILSEMATLDTVTPTETPPPEAPPMRVDLTDTGGGGSVPLVGAASVPDAGPMGEVIPQAEPEEDTLSPAAMLDTEPDTAVVVELPATEPAAPPAPAPDVAAAGSAAAAAPTTLTISRPAVTTPVDADWRRKYYQRVVGKRALALLLDFAVLFVAVPFIVGMGWAIIADAVGVSDNMFDTVFDWIFYLCIAVFYLGAPALESSRWRATPGKRILRLEIATKEGDRIGYGRAFVRNVLRTATLYMYMVTLGLGLIAQYFRFRKTKKLFHDELSSTVIGERVAKASAPAPASAPS